jgi:hypothetical protein
MSISWFCQWQASGNDTLPLSPSDLDTLVSLLSKCPGMGKGYIMTPTSAYDPYYTDMSGSPSLVLQFEFSEILALEQCLTRNGYLAPLVRGDILPGLANAVVSHQGFLGRQYPVPDPVLASADGRALTYLVEYPGSAVDENAWHAFYVSHHPKIMAKFPGIRYIEIFTPTVVICELPLFTRSAMQCNKTVFDSTGAMNAAMLSPVRDEMRRDFVNFPPFEGGNTHYPFRTTIVPGIMIGMTEKFLT